jgi:hypothetical protein
MAFQATAGCLCYPNGRYRHTSLWDREARISAREYRTIFKILYIEFYFRQTQQYTNELSHTTYIHEFIGKIVQLRYMFRLIEPSSGAILTILYYWICTFMDRHDILSPVRRYMHRLYVTPLKLLDY